MLVLEAFLLLVSLAIAAALVSRLWTRRRDDGAEDLHPAAHRDRAQAHRGENGGAEALSTAEQLWLELESRMEGRPLRYPYKG
jgi:hypothetical protein